MKKILFLLFVVSSLFLVSCEKENKICNSKTEKNGTIVYVSVFGNEYSYRSAVMINKGYLYQSNHYFNSNDDVVDILLKEIPTNNYTKRSYEEFREELLSEDVNNVYVFRLNYGNDGITFLESIEYYFAPTKILLSCRNNKKEAFYVLTIDELFYNDFYQLEYQYMIEK